MRTGTSEIFIVVCKGKIVGAYSNEEVTKEAIAYMLNSNKKLDSNDFSVEKKIINGIYDVA